MSVENLSTKATYSTNGVVKDFDIPFDFTNENQIAVYITDMTLGETTKITANVEVNPYTKKVTYPTHDDALDVGFQITVIRETDLTQSADFTQSGWFTAKAVMNTIDKLTLVVQEHAEKLNRTIRYSVNETPTESETKGFLSIVEAARDAAIEARDQAIVVYDLAVQAKNDVINTLDTKQVEVIDAITDHADSVIGGMNDIVDQAEGIRDAILLIQGDVTTKQGQVNTAVTTAQGHANSAFNYYNSTNNIFNDVTLIRDQILSLSNAVNDYYDGVVSMTSTVVTKWEDVIEYANQASLSASSASDSLNAVNEAISKIIWNDVVFLTSVDSPFAINDSHNGKLLSIDCSGGDVVLNLPLINDLNLTAPWSMGVKKTDIGSNKVSITPQTADRIDGKTVKEINTQDAGATIIPDIDPNPDQWTSCDFGAGGGGIGQAQGTRQSPLLLLATSQITPLPQKATQVIFISGSASAITLTDLKPLKTDNMVIGQKITLVCTSDANPVTFQSTVNFILNGEATLYKDDVLLMEFIGSDGTNDSYIEIGRNF